MMTTLLFRFIAKKIALLNRILFLTILCVLGTTKAQSAYTYFDLAENSTPEIYNSQAWKALLHYDNEQSFINKDSNFFLSAEGYKNPHEEYLATLKAFVEPKNLNDSHAICRYPARFEYIIKSLRLQKDDFPHPDCKSYDEYHTKVPADKIAIIFASENNLSPSSMMGHIFLKLSGNNSTGYKEHAFGYFAAISNYDNLKFYLDVTTTGLDGAYVLSPYREKADEYLLKEKRSLWEFEIELTPEQKRQLLNHIWELKEKNIRYKFVTHNCNTALAGILNAVDKDFATSTVKPFQTPVEYLQNLSDKNKLSNISIEPTKSQKEVIKKYGLNYIGNAPKPTRFSVKQDFQHQITEINFSPVYQDIRDISNAYFPELETKIFDITLNYNAKHNDFAISKVDILKMISIIDYPVSESFSKYFRLGFENNLYASKTQLKPIAEFGLGLGKKIYGNTFYFLPKIGYRYDKFSNFYIAPQIGVITKFGEDIKMINSYEKYFDSRKNNRGFSEKYNFYIGYKILTDSEIYLDYEKNTDAKYSDQFSIGFSVHF